MNDETYGFMGNVRSVAFHYSWQISVYDNSFFPGKRGGFYCM